MLSTVTPLAERARGHRFSVTATWYVAGSLLGGLTLGALAAVPAWLPGTTVAPPARLALALAGAFAAVAAASDLGVFGFRLPMHCRQVNELWLNRYRPWVYGLGFGWQIGVGLATFTMTAGIHLMVVLMVVLAVLTGSPLAALAIGALFGLVRGLAIVPARRITTPAALQQFHRRFDALEPATRRAMNAVLVLVAGAATVAAWAPARAGVAVVAVSVLVMVVGVAATIVELPARRPAGRLDTTPPPPAAALGGGGAGRAAP
jgi:hypothetical protein